MRTDNKISKLSKIFIAAIALVLSSIFALACDAKSNVEIELDTSGVKTEFAVNEKFACDGLSVVAVMDGERYSVPVGECEIDIPDMSAVGEKTVTVRFMNASASYKITVAEFAVGLVLGVENVKTVYAAGETLDTSGLEVEALLNSGARRAVDSFTCASADMSAPGNKRIDVTAEYDGDELTASFNVCVLPKAASAYGLDEKMEFSTSGDGSLTLYISSREGGGVNSADAHTYGYLLLRGGDGACELFDFEYTYTPQGWASTFVKGIGTERIDGDGALTVTAGGESYSAVDGLWHYVVIGWDELERISLDTSGVKKNYFAGESFDAGGLVVTAHMYGGAEQTATENISYSGFDPNVIGEQTVTVSYGGFTAEYKITVRFVATSLAVDYSNAKREYVVNVPFTSDGLVVYEVNVNGVRRTLSSDAYEISSPDMSVIGVKTVTVKHKTDESISAEYMIYAIPDVPWETNRLEFVNQTGTGDTLDLFVTSIEGGGGWDKKAISSGWYLFKCTDGTYAMYEFAFSYGYQPEGQEQCHFETQGLDAEYLDNDFGGDMFVKIGDVMFRANADYWHHIIMKW